MYILASFVKDKSTHIWTPYLWAFYFVPLIYICGILKKGKKKATNELIYKNRMSVMDVENELMVTRRVKGGGRNWKTGIDEYTLCVNRDN